jgi:heptosyltransferase-2
VSTGLDQKRGVARILVLELWNIGDLILVMPFLSQLRARFPHAKVTLLARPLAQELLSGTGLVDEVIPTELNWTPRGETQRSKKTIAMWRAVKRLRASRFDIGFSARLHLREHVLLALSGARRTVGYELSEEDSALTDPVGPAIPRGHKVEDWMRLLAPFGGASTAQIPRLFVSDDERAWAKGYLAARGLSEDDLIIGVHPGASLVEKRWPLDGFRRVATEIAAQAGVRLLAFAEPSGYGAELFSIPGIVPARPTLREMIALIACCDLLVCNDSGPMHVAGALGVPTVALFGHGVERWFAPLGENHQILRAAAVAPQGEPSVGAIRSPTGISSSDVLDAVGKAVQRLRSGRTLSRV